MIFLDRIDAAHKLAHVLQRYKPRNPLTLAIPRGVVPMGGVIAEALDGELDVVLVRKIGAPFLREFALAAVDETGWVYCNPNVDIDSATRAYIEQQRVVQLETMRQRRALYTPGRAPIDPAGRIVIVVDDGLATGATMIAALHSLRSKHPRELICAIPVAPPDVMSTIGPYADTVICLSTPDDFGGVSQFYQHFDQVNDETVAAELDAFATRQRHRKAQAVDNSDTRTA